MCITEDLNRLRGTLSGASTLFVTYIIFFLRVYYLHNILLSFLISVFFPSHCPFFYIKHKCSHALSYFHLYPVRFQYCIIRNIEYASIQRAGAHPSSTGKYSVVSLCCQRGRKHPLSNSDSDAALVAVKWNF